MAKVNIKFEIIALFLSFFHEIENFFTDAKLVIDHEQGLRCMKKPNTFVFMAKL